MLGSSRQSGSVKKDNDDDKISESEIRQAMGQLNQQSVRNSKPDNLQLLAGIASLAIPWGEAKGDADSGGYHLVWTRDMVSSAAGETKTALRSLIYLATTQEEDGAADSSIKTFPASLVAG